MVLCLPVNVVVCVILSIIVCPKVVLHKGARAVGIEMTSWDWAVTILLTEVMGVSAGVTAVSPAIAVPAVVILGATRSEVADLITGAASHPGF